jgi:type II secretory pathway pseudopilin PulG
MKRLRGFSLVDTLFAVSLLGVFTLLAARLLFANSGIVRATLDSDSNTARFDRAVAQLRADVQSSASIEMPQPGDLQIHEPGEKIVEWHAAARTLTRRSGDQLRSWDIGQPLALKLDGAVALLSITPTDEIALAATPKGAPQ